MARLNTRPGRRGRGGYLELSPVPPFDFDLSASIFSEGDPEIRSFTDGAFRQPLRARGQLVLVTVRSEGTVDHPSLRVRADPGPLPPGVLEAAGEAVTRLFNLGLDLSLFAGAVQADPVMSAIARRLRGLKPPRTATVFEALVDSIIEQQISLSAAHSIERRIVHTFGETLELEHGTYYAFPSPASLADASLEELRACGLSGKKAEYITGIARRVRDGTLNLENHKPGEETASIIRDLTAIRGVGVCGPRSSRPSGGSRAWMPSLRTISGYGGPSPGIIPGDPASIPARPAGSRTPGGAGEALPHTIFSSRNGGGSGSLDRRLDRGPEGGAPTRGAGCLTRHHPISIYRNREEGILPRETGGYPVSRDSGGGWYGKADR